MSARQCHSLESSVILSCSNCDQFDSRAFPLVPDIASLNKQAFCVSLMSGRRFAVSRFLSWLGIGNGDIQKRDNSGTWINQLLVAAEAIYVECKSCLTEAFVLGSSPVISADVAYKRNAKAYQQGLGAALSSLLSVCDSRLGKVLAAFVFERRILEEKFQEHGKITLESTVVGAPPVSTEYAAGGDHAVFELGLALFHQEARHVCQNLSGNEEMAIAYAEIAILGNDWTLARVTSSSPR